MALVGGDAGVDGGPDVGGQLGGGMKRGSGRVRLARPLDLALWSSSSCRGERLGGGEGGIYTDDGVQVCLLTGKGAINSTTTQWQ